MGKPQEAREGPTLIPEPSLLRVPATSYGEEYRGHLLEIYKLYVATAEATSTRRNSANSWLLALNVLLVSLSGVVARDSGDGNEWLAIIGAAGVLVSFVWFVLIRNYRSLNTGKFAVIHELEEHLPVAVFDREWHHLEQGRGKAYSPLTHIEQYIPILFAGLYIVVGIIGLTG